MKRTRRTYVSMASPGNILRRGAVFHGKNTLSNHLTSVGADDMDTEYLVSLLLREEFDETISVEVGLSTGVGREAEFSDVVLHASLLQILLGLANPGDLGVGVDNGGDGAVVNMAVTMLDELDGSDT
jgi:hypothetical protein